MCVEEFLLSFKKGNIVSLERLFLHTLNHFDGQDKTRDRPVL